MKSYVIHGIGMIVVSCFGISAHGATNDIENQLQRLLEQKGGIQATYKISSGFGWESLTVLKTPVDAKVVERQFGKPAKTEKDVGPFSPEKSGVVISPQKGSLWQYKRIDLFVRDGNILQFALWKDNRESRLLGHLATISQGIQTYETVRHSGDAPDRAGVLNQSVDVNDVVAVFGKPDQVAKGKREFIPTMRTGFWIFADSGELWTYGRVALFVKDAKVRQFAEWNGGTSSKENTITSTESQGGAKEPGKQIEKTPDILPGFKDELQGTNPVRVRNPNNFAVTVGIRTGQKGKDFNVVANGVTTAEIPDGKYDIYFVYSDKPDALFQGDSFTLNNKGVEIQIVKVVNGNYGIRQVK